MSEGASMDAPPVNVDGLFAPDAKKGLIEQAALAMVNADQRRLDMPELASIEDFRRESDRDVYLALARAAFSVLLSAIIQPKEEQMPKGPAFLLKIGDGVSPPAFSTIAGMRVVSFTVDGVEAGPGDVKGTARLKIDASGIFTGSDAEARIKANALASTIDDYELSFESGEKVRGRLFIARLNYSGDYNGERNYSLSLAGASS